MSVGAGEKDEKRTVALSSEEVEEEVEVGGGVFRRSHARTRLAPPSSSARACSSMSRSER